MRSSLGFWYLTGGEVVQNVGNHFLTVAISAYAYSVSGTTWGFALQQLVIFLPWALFATFAGPVVDRLDKRRVLIAADWVRVIICLMYPACRTLHPILVLNFLNSTTRVFATSARAALVPRLCLKERLLEANGLRTSVFGVVDMLGPAMAGALMAHIGTTTGFFITSAAVLVGSAAFLLVPSHAGKPISGFSADHTNSSGLLRDIGAGVSFLRHHKALMSGILIYCVYLLGQNGINAVFYPYIESVLKAGPATFGLCVSSYYGANFLVGIFLAKWGKIVSGKPLVAFMLPGTMIWVAYSLVRLVPVMLVMSFVEGTIMALLSTLFITKIQTHSPEGMVGRVWGVANSLTSICEATGILATGILADKLGIPASYRLIGLTIGVSIVAIHLFQRTRTVSKEREKAGMPA